MSMSTAANLLVRLSTDPALRSRFQANPIAVLDEAGITGEDRDILMSGNPDRLRSRFAGGDAPPGCLVLYDPGDDAPPGCFILYDPGDDVKDI